MLKKVNGAQKLKGRTATESLFALKTITELVSASSQKDMSFIRWILKNCTQIISLLDGFWVLIAEAFTGDRKVYTVKQSNIVGACVGGKLKVHTL